MQNQGPSPAANCVPAVRTGNLLFIADQVPVQDGKPQFLGVAAFSIASSAMSNVSLAFG